MTITFLALFLGLLLVYAGVRNYSLVHLLRGEQVERG